MIDLKFYRDVTDELGIVVTQGSFLVEGDSPDDSHLNDAGLDSSAIDLRLPEGTSVYAFSAGRVVGAFAGYTDALYPTAPTTGPASFGNYVTVDYDIPVVARELR
jgi:hypothetical protein